MTATVNEPEEAMEWPRWQWLERTIPVRMLLALTFVMLGSSNILLWRFLGIGGISAVFAGIACLAAIAWAVLRTPWNGDTADAPTIGTWLVCTGIIAILLVIAGEGRFFYANVDWQVRSAVMHDMGVNPWPFVYLHDGGKFLLRAPLGVYLIPAAAWKLIGARGADLILLAQNAFIIGTLLTAASAMFDRASHRFLALAVFVAFSGLDVVGALLTHGFTYDHLELWAGRLEYSSTITLLFWVPQHAIAGWVGTVCYLLWLRGLAPARLLLIATPLSAIWSPLALIGLMPFAAHAGISLIASRKLCVGDVAFPALAVALVYPTLRYLGSDPGAVGYHLYDIALMVWALFMLIEVVPFLYPLIAVAIQQRKFDATLAIVGMILLFLPFLQVGAAIDLMMRASIPALAILSVLVTERMLANDGEYRNWLMIMLIIGSVTGGMEISRAFREPDSPETHCTIFEAWDAGTVAHHGIQGQGIPKGTYLADLDLVPGMVRPASPHDVQSRSGRRCWDTPWPRPAGI
ncbi:hypothetical protein RXV95_06585 [Novosphingobium sp. ZN18A2]|uniref:hypothetical protein n=1 Tax=Novosphingobium sp. ZN18A2 TaxID=3079861 RepID=UPI0030CB16EE